MAAPRFQMTKFSELEEGYRVKVPPRGKDARTGEVFSCLHTKDKTSILVRWEDDGAVSRGSHFHDTEICAKAPNEPKKEKENASGKD